MQRWSALFLLLGLAQAQGFFGLGAVDGNVFGFGQAFPAGLWWRVGVDHNLDLLSEGVERPARPYAVKPLVDHRGGAH